MKKKSEKPLFEQRLSTGQVSKATCIPFTTLKLWRYYDLLNYHTDENNNYHYFDIRDLGCLSFVSTMRSIGATYKEIKQHEKYSLDDRLSFYDNQISKAKNQIEELQKKCDIVKSYSEEIEFIKKMRDKEFFEHQPSYDMAIEANLKDNDFVRLFTRMAGKALTLCLLNDENKICDNIYLITIKQRTRTQKTIWKKEENDKFLATLLFDRGQSPVSREVTQKLINKVVNMGGKPKYIIIEYLLDYFEGETHYLIYRLLCQYTPKTP